MEEMKALSMDLRKRVVKFLEEGGGKVEASRRFGVSRRSVYRYLEAQKQGRLEPKKSWGGWRKLDPGKLREYAASHPDATLTQMGAFFGVCHQAVWRSLRAMGFTEKKTTRCREADPLQRWLFVRYVDPVGRLHPSPRGEASGLT